VHPGAGRTLGHRSVKSVGNSKIDSVYVPLLEELFEVGIVPRQREVITLGQDVELFAVRGNERHELRVFACVLECRKHGHLGEITQADDGITDSTTG